MRINPQISPIPLPSLRVPARQRVEPAANCSRPPCEPPAASREACDRYEPGGPGPLRYADYLEKQNQRKAEQPPAPVANPEPREPRAPAAAPADTGLGPKLGDIPAPKASPTQHQRIITAYQVQRVAPTGSLVDVLI
ncbi:MAG: hypothetical protein ACF8MJ_06055 [Phycisphaerales bacterium JB050]